MLLNKWIKHHDKKADYHLDAARKGGILAVYKLFNRYYLKSFFGPFFTFVFPVMLFGILGSLMDYKILFPGLVAMSAMSSGISGMPFSILELKKSVLLKRIGASPVKPSTFTIVIITYYTFTILVSIFWLMIWALIFHQDTSMFKPMGHVVGFFGFLYGNILNIIVSLAIGFAISAISKSEVQAQTIGMLIYFPATFLSGQFVSIDSIAASEVMNWISRFIPFRYTTMIIIESWTGDTSTIGAAANTFHHLSDGNPFAIHEYWIPGFNQVTPAMIVAGQPIDPSKLVKTSLIFDKADHICGYVVPYVMLVGAGWFSIKKFSWTAAR